MPYYSELGLTSTPSSSAYSSILLSGPYAKHSSIIASNFTPSYTKPIPRQFRGGYKPHLSSISELNSSLRRINSPKTAYLSPSISIRPIKTINTADIDVSVNRNRKKFDKYEKFKPDTLEKPSSAKEKSPSPKKEIPNPEEQREAKPNPTIRRDRTTVRLQTVHKDTLEKQIGAIKSWRDNFKPDELGVEAKRRKKTQGEILKEKFLIRSRSKDNLLNPADLEVNRKKPYRKSPSFHDICTAISSGDLENDLNPGQPVEVQRRQSRQIPGEKILKEIRRTSTELSEEDLNILNEILTQKSELTPMPEDDILYDPRESVRRKKLTKKHSGTIQPILSRSSDENNNLEERSLPTNHPVEKVLKRTKSKGIKESDSLKDEIHKSAIRDISQVEIQQTKFKPKPKITASVDDIKDPTPKLKPIVDEAEVEETQKMKKEKKFRFNVIVEVETEYMDRNKPSVKQSKSLPGKITFSEDMTGVVQLEKPKTTVVTSILKKRPLMQKGYIPAEKDNIIQNSIMKGVVQLPKPKTTVVTSILKKTSPVQIGHISSQKKNLGTDISSATKCLKENGKIGTTTEYIDTNGMKNTNEMPKLQSLMVKEKPLINKILPRIENSSAPELSPVTRKVILGKESNSMPISMNKKETGSLDHEIQKTSEDVTSKSAQDSKSGTEGSQGNLRRVFNAKNEISSTTSKPTPLLNKLLKKENNSAPELSGNMKSHDFKSTPTLSSLSIGTKINSAPTSVHSRRVAASNSSNTSASEKNTVEDSVQKISDGVKKEPELEVSVDQTNEEQNLNNTDVSEPLSPEETAKRKLMSKRSLVQKANKDDPDLKVFIPPEPEPEPEPEPDKKEAFVPLQSNRLSQWMHPWKKPEQLDECPVEIFARPKVIRGRHYPRPRGHPAQPPPEPESSSEEDEEEDESEEDSSSEETSSEEDEYQGSTVSNKIGASTSSNDSGFGSGVPGKNKECDVNIHKKCEKLTANLCGVNQKLVVEAIESVRKGSLDSRDSPTTNPANNPAFALDFGDIPEEYSHSSTFTGFQRSGRITPPATTIPRFRKYCIDDFNFLKVLGKGSFGKVLLAELKETEYYYAVKCLKKDVVLEDDDVECTLIERKVLALGTKHPYLCHLLCTFQTESHLFFVMEYLNGGDLMFHIQASGRFPEHQARFYGAEIVSGLKFLHNKGIVYRDLKLDNILLDFDGHVRIADFGMCKLQIFLDRMAETFCGTPDYMAPEIIKGQHYNQCVDWWSFGVLLYEMLLGQSPFSGCDEDELFWSICNEKPVLPRFLSSEATSILTMFLEKDASKRLGNRFSPHGDIQDQPFFRAIDWYALEARQLEPPFKPNLQHPLDTQYFDKHFTVEKAKLTPIESTILQSMDQTQFQGFSYTNPNATDK